MRRALARIVIVAGAICMMTFVAALFYTTVANVTVIYAASPLMAAVLDGLPARFHESPIQTRAEVDEAICVTSKVFAASDPEASALPALNPYQPSQSSVAPMTASGIL